MNDSKVEHQVKGPGLEEYVFKLKDRMGRGAIRIANPSGTPMVLQEIRIMKKQGENNKILVQLVKALEES